MSIKTVKRLVLGQTQRALERAYAELCMECAEARHNDELLSGLLFADFSLRTEVKYL